MIYALTLLLLGFSDSAYVIRKDSSYLIEYPSLITTDTKLYEIQRLMYYNVINDNINVIRSI